jgi:O-antigen/teichoic acid export membrane protein
VTDGIGVYFEKHQESKDLGRRALRGGIVSIAIKYGNGVLQIAAAIVLARLLAPEDFGLVAIVTVLTSFAPLLIDFGLGDATTQRGAITPAQVSGLFWVSTGIGLVVALIVAACSPLIAKLYSEPRLQPITLLIATTFLLSGLSSQHLALLRRSMQFGRIGRIQVFGTLAGVVVAIIVASSGYGYWALVLRQITTSFCVAAGAWSACRWKPGRPVFDDEVKSMIGFGLHIVGFSVAYTVSRAVDRIALGLFYQPDQVGYYQSAMNLYDNTISSTIEQAHTVGSAALSRLQSDPVAIRKRYEAALSMLAFFLMPLSAILSVTAQDLTVILLGDKWRAAGSLLSIIALRGIFQAIEGSQGWLHVSIGRVDRWRNWGVFSLLVQFIAVLGGLPFGATGVATGLVIAFLFLALPSIVFAGRPIGIGAAFAVHAVGAPLIGAISTAAAGWWLHVTLLADYSSYVRILVLGGFCTIVYLAVVVGLFRVTEPIRLIRTIGRELIGRR